MGDDLSSMYSGTNPNRRNARARRQANNPRKPKRYRDLSEEYSSLGRTNRAWQYNPNFPDMKEIEKKERQMNDPYAFNTWLDEIIKNRMYADVEKYKNDLKSKRDGDSLPDPSYRHADTDAELANAREIVGKGKNADFVYSRFLGNLEKNQVRADEALRYDRKYESDPKNKFIPQPGSKQYDDESIPKEFKADAKKAAKGVKTDRYQNQNGDMVQVIDGDHYIEKINSKGERVYYNIAAFNKAADKQNAAYEAERKKNKEEQYKRDRSNISASEVGPAGAAFDLGINGISSGLRGAGGWLNDALFENDPVRKAKKFGIEAALETVHKISAPLYGIQGMRSAWYDMDKEEGSQLARKTDVPLADATYSGKHNWFKDHLYNSSRFFASLYTDPFGLEKFVSGGRVGLDSLDDLSKEGVKEVFARGGEGVRAGLFDSHKTALENPKVDWGGKMVADNAASDNVVNMYDSKGMQAAGSLGGAVVFDPFSWVSGKAISRVVNSADDFTDLLLSGDKASNVWSASKKIQKIQIAKADLMENPILASALNGLSDVHPGEYLSSKEIYELLGGYRPGRFGSEASRSEAEKVTTEFMNIVHDRTMKGGLTPGRAANIDRKLKQDKDFGNLLDTARKRREMLQIQAKTDVLHDELLRTMGLKLDQGHITQAEYDAMRTSIDEASIMEMLEKGREHFKRRKGIEVYPHRNDAKTVPANTPKNRETHYQNVDEYNAAKKQEWLDEHPSFESMISDALKDHPHLDPSDYANIEDRVHRHLNKHEKSYSDSYDEIRVLKPERTKYSDEYDDVLRKHGLTRQSPRKQRNAIPEVKEAAKRFFDTNARINHLYKNNEMLKANAILRTLHDTAYNRVTGATGIPIDSERAAALSTWQNKLDDYYESSHADTTSNIRVGEYSTDYAEGHRTAPYKGEPGEKFAGASQPVGSPDRLKSLSDMRDDLREMPLEDLNNPLVMEEYFNPANWNGRPEDHLESLTDALTGKYGAIAHNTSDISGVKWKDIKKPESLADDVDTTFLSKVIHGDADSGNIFPRYEEAKKLLGRELTLEETEYFKSIAQAVEQKHSGAFSRAYRNDTAARRSREAKSIPGKKRQETSNFTEALAPVTEGGVGGARHAAAQQVKHAYAPLPGSDQGYGWVVHGTNGKAAYLDDINKVNAGLEDRLTDVGLAVERQDIEASERLTGYFDRMDRGEILSHDEALEATEAINRAGYAAPSDPGMLRHYWNGLGKDTSPVGTEERVLEVAGFGDKEKAKRVREALRKLEAGSGANRRLKPGDRLKNAEVKELRETMLAAGLNPPDDIRNMPSWWARTKAEHKPRKGRIKGKVRAHKPKDPNTVIKTFEQKGSVRNSITGARMRFNRAFEEQHGMPLSEAKKYRDVATDAYGNRSATATHGKWHDQWSISGDEGVHHVGTTKPEFLKNVLSGDLEAMRSMMRKSPFRFMESGFKHGGREYTDDMLGHIHSKGYTYEGQHYKGKPSGDLKGKEALDHWRAYNEAYEKNFLAYTKDLHDYLKFNPDAIPLMEKAWDTRMRARKGAQETNAAKLDEAEQIKRQEAAGEIKQQDYLPTDSGMRRYSDHEIRAAHKAELDEARRLGDEISPAVADPKRKKELWLKAFQDARNESLRDIDSIKALDNQSIEIPIRVSDPGDFNNILKLVEEKYGSETAAELAALRKKRQEAPMQELKELDAQIKRLESKRARNRNEVGEMRRKAQEASEATMKLLKDEALMAVKEAVVQRRMPGVELTFAGSKSKEIRLPDNQSIRAFAKWANETGFAIASKKAWQASFAAPMASRNADVILEALRYKADTPGIIRHHLDALDKSLGKMPAKQRADIYRRLAEGEIFDIKTNPIAHGIQNEFTRLVRIFNGDGPHGLVRKELYRFMPRELQLKSGSLSPIGDGKYGFKTVQDMIRVFRNELSHNSKTYEDPMNTLWDLTIAIEQATAYKVMKDNLSGTVGIKRHQSYQLEDEIKALEMSKANRKEIYLKKKELSNMRKSMSPWERELADLTELHKANGYRTINRKGWDDEYYFPEEIAKDIEKIDEMFTPEGISAMGKGIDRIFDVLRTAAAKGHINPDPLNTAQKGLMTGGQRTLAGFDAATRGWKTAATIYNPGYYTRNFIGEVMTGWMGGVNNPKYYRQAMEMLRYSREDVHDISKVLSQHEVYKNFKSKKDLDPSKTLIRLPDGQRISLREAIILYSDQGLKTGFLNTERASKVMEGKGFSLGRNSTTGKKRLPGRFNDEVRRRGEAAEDWPRMAHFLHSLENAPKSMKSIEKRAQYAAEQVRKYHFDYSDVSKFEQTVMARALPFYKWSRKMLPLMTESLFLRPGKVLAYPKTMASLGMAANPEGVNGTLMPEFDGMVPGFLRDMWAYQMGEDQEGRNTFMNVATPVMDMMKQVADPVGSAVELFNPVVKAPVEWAMGHTFGDPDNGIVMDRDFQLDSKLLRFTGDKKQNEAVRSNYGKLFGLTNTPLGSIISKGLTKKDGIWTETGGRLDETITSFGTGLGFYEDTSRMSDPDFWKSRKTDPHKPTVVGGE